jgi:hypothetical protein
MIAWIGGYTPICGMATTASTQPDLLTPDLEAAKADQRPALQALPGQKRPTGHGRPIPSPVAEDRSATGVGDRTKPGSPDSQVWYTFGPHAIGTERFPALSSGLKRCVG